MLFIQIESLTVNIVRSENLKLKSHFHYITDINITIPIVTKLDIINSLSKNHHTVGSHDLPREFKVSV